MVLNTVVLVNITRKISDLGEPLAGVGASKASIFFFFFKVVLRRHFVLPYEPCTSAGMCGRLGFFVS